MLENEIDKMLNNSDSADSHNHKRKSLGRGLGALLGDCLLYTSPSPRDRG